MTEDEFNTLTHSTVEEIRKALVDAGVKDFGAPWMLTRLRSIVRTAMILSSNSPLPGRVVQND